MVAARSLSAPAPAPGGRAPVLVGPHEALRVREAVAGALPVPGGAEPHLRGVIEDVLSHPGGLLRAQLAYGLGLRLGLPGPAALPLAVAVELFHTASLVFDDLPAMDGARTRRGRPCPHVVHGEAAAILGGLALVTRGFALLAEGLEETTATRRQAASARVAQELGPAGILDGQARDVHFAPRAGAEEAARTAAAKTVPLLRLALLLPAICAGAPRPVTARLETLAASWGLAYQVLDDFKDRWLADHEAGKCTGRDGRLGRPSVPLHAGEGPALVLVRSLLAGADEALDGLERRRPGRWAPLHVLQRFLDDGRRAAEARRASTCTA